MKFFKRSDNTFKILKEKNSHFVSVKKQWDELLNSPKETIVNEVNRVCSEDYKNMMEQIFDSGEYYFVPAYMPFEFGLLLNMYSRDVSWINYYNAKAVKISGKVRKYLHYNDQQNNNDNSAKLYTSSETLIGFVVLASAKEFKSPTLPNKEILMEGLLPFMDRLNKSKSKIPFEEKEKCILASIMSLLSGEYDLSAQFLSYCKTLKAVKHYYSSLSKLTNALISNQDISDNSEVEAAFFQIFNIHRLPVFKYDKEIIGEFPVTNHFVMNYLFAWLYLKLFEGKDKTSWEEMRMIMTA